MTQKANRRTFLAATPAIALLVGAATPASGASLEDARSTPILGLFADWQAARDAFNDYPDDDAVGDFLWGRMYAIETKLLSMPVIGPADFAAKMQVATDLGGLEPPAWLVEEAELLTTMSHQRQALRMDHAEWQG